MLFGYKRDEKGRAICWNVRRSDAACTLSYEEGKDEMNYLRHQISHGERPAQFHAAVPCGKTTPCTLPRAPCFSQSFFPPFTYPIATYWTSIKVELPALNLLPLPCRQSFPVSGQRTYPNPSVSFRFFL
jgi:hypothetical protein